MQIYADVTGCTMKISGSSQTCALGSAIAAACVAGLKAGGYASFERAQAKMTSVKTIEYHPDKKAGAVYNELYALYRKLHDGFGGVGTSAEFGDVMKKLISIKERASKA